MFEAKRKKIYKETPDVNKLRLILCLTSFYELAIDDVLGCQNTHPTSSTSLQHSYLTPFPQFFRIVLESRRISVAFFNAVTSWILRVARLFKAPRLRLSLSSIAFFLMPGKMRWYVGVWCAVHE